MMMRPLMAAGWLCLLLLCCGAWAASPKLDLPTARCLTPDGEELDFADLVAMECKKPSKKGQPPANPKPGEVPIGVKVTVTPAPEPDKEDCERGVTAGELQRNIINASDTRCVAQILIQTGSVGGIEDGFRIDPDFNFRPNCANRRFDPDVVALKGIALGLLVGAPRDGGLVDKVVDGVVPSFTPPGESGSGQSKKGKESHTVDRDAFADVLGNSTLLLEAFNENANNSPPCKPGKPYGGRRSLLSDLFSGRQALISAAEEFVGSSARRLQCADCDNADSFTCAYCWQQGVCEELYWCQG